MLDDLRELAEPWFTGQWPRQNCPTCWQGRLRLDGKLVCHSDHQTLVDSRDERWEPEFATGVFSGMLECNDSSCSESVAISGTWQLEYLPADDGGPDSLEEHCSLKFAHPPLPLFNAPHKTPDNVVEAIERASSVMWAQPDAAANQLRQAVELLLDRLRVPKTAPRPNGKRRNRSLAERITELRRRPKYVQVAKLFDALRHRGNVGSHKSGLNATHVLDMAQILELALRLLYEKTDDETRALAAKMIKRKGRP